MVYSPEFTSSFTFQTGAANSAIQTSFGFSNRHFLVEAKFHFFEISGSILKWQGRHLLRFYWRNIHLFQLYFDRGNFARCMFPYDFLASQVFVNGNSGAASGSDGIYHRATFTRGISCSKNPGNICNLGNRVNDYVLSSFCKSCISFEKSQVRPLPRSNDYRICFNNKLRPLYRYRGAPSSCFLFHRPHAPEFNTSHFPCSSNDSYRSYQVFEFDSFFLSFGNFLGIRRQVFPRIPVHHKNLFAV